MKNYFSWQKSKLCLNFFETDSRWVNRKLNFRTHKKVVVSLKSKEAGKIPKKLSQSIFWCTHMQKLTLEV